MAAAMLLCLQTRQALRREWVYCDRSDPLQLENEILLRQYCFPRAEILNFENPTHRSCSSGIASLHGFEILCL